MRVSVIVCLVLCCFACGTSKDINSLSWKKKLKIAEKLSNSGSYYNAVDYYKEVYKEQPENVLVIYKLAGNYEKSRDYENAEFWYKTLLQVDKGSIYPEAAFNYAKMLQMNGKYDLAKNAYKDFSKTYKGAKAAELTKLAKNEIKSCEFAIEEIKNPQSVRITHGGPVLNAAYHDFAPQVLPDGKIMFSSLRSDTLISTPERLESLDALTRMYEAKKVGGKFTERIPLQVPLPEEMAHYGNGAFSPDMQRFYFSKGIQEGNDKIVGALFVVQKKDGEWTLPEPLNSYINVPGFTSTQPSVAAYQKGAEILYFVSNMPGGEGGMDLFYSIRTSQGVYKEPVNLGRNLNTTQDEMSPNFDKVTQSLYFSSNGHTGMGGMDNFSSDGLLRKWAKPINLGYPINSSVDDMYFVPDGSGISGYFVSNRPGGIVLKSKTCCDDIWEYKWTEKIVVAVEGYVFDVNDTTHTPLSGATVKLELKDPETGTYIGIAADTTVGTKMYFYQLNLNRDYQISGSKSGYFSGKGLFTDFTRVTTIGIEESDTLRADLYLNKMDTGIGYVLQNIYYDFDKATLRPESEQTLDSLLLIMNDHPNMKVEIGSHTDTRGSDDYNIKLSQKRAESVVRWLIKNDVPKELLVAKGYGETVNLEDCSKFKECPDNASRDCPCHQMNRRTEFKVLGLVENLIYRQAGKEVY